MLTNADPHIIGTVTVLVVQDELEKGDQCEHEFPDGDDEDEDAEDIDHTKLVKDVVLPHTPTKRSFTVSVCQHLHREDFPV